MKIVSQYFSWNCCILKVTNRKRNCCAVILLLTYVWSTPVQTNQIKCTLVRLNQTQQVWWECSRISPFVTAARLVWNCSDSPLSILGPGSSASSSMFSYLVLRQLFQARHGQQFLTLTQLIFYIEENNQSTSVINKSRNLWVCVVFPSPAHYFLQCIALLLL